MAAPESVCAPAAFSLSDRASSDASATSSLGGGELGLAASPALAPGKQLSGGERHVNFNIMVAGQSKVGKSRFIASLADSFGVDEANTRPLRSSSSGLSASGRSATLDRHARELQTHLAPLALPGRQPGRQLHIMLQDTQGHGSENNKAMHLAQLLEHLLHQREVDYLAARASASTAATAAAGKLALPHSLSLCLYFLPPTEVSALDLAYMSALSQEVPLLPVLVPQPDAPEEQGGGPVSPERLAALRRSLVAAMAGYTRDGKSAPIVPLALDPEAVDALLQQQEVEVEEAEWQAQQAARPAAGGNGENGPRTRRRGSASSLSVLVLGDGGACSSTGGGGSLQRPDAALLRRLLDCSVEPVLRSATERFVDFAERYEMYGNDVMFMLSERMEPYGKAIRAAEAADAAAAARRQQEAATAAVKAAELDAKAAAHAVTEAAVINVIVRDATHTITENAVSNVIARDAAHTITEHAVSNVIARDAAHTITENAVSNVIARDAAHTITEQAVTNVIARDAAHTITEQAVTNVIARDAAHTVAHHAVSNVIAAASEQEQTTGAVGAGTGHATKRGHDSLQASAADTDAEDATRHAARPRALTPPPMHSPFTVLATDAAAGTVARSPTPRFAAPPAAADAFAAPPCPPSPEPEHDGEGEAEVERVVSAIEEIVTQLSRSLEASGSDGEHSARVSPRDAPVAAIGVGAPFGAVAEEGEGEGEGDAVMEEAVEEAAAGGAEWEGGALAAEAAVVSQEQGEMFAAAEEGEQLETAAAGPAAPAAAAASGIAKLVTAGSDSLRASIASVRRYWSRSLSMDGAGSTGAAAAAANGHDSDDTGAGGAAAAAAAAAGKGSWPATVRRCVPATATSAAVGVGLVGLAAGTAAVVLMQRSRSAAMTA
ncbi:hypothetical protein HYH02_007215 [Chlamydomonas schloesseri]|uniref:Septin-type G domain-containing protein n=1 Tax=Chlamydomonas schloesseri TaxID=2026947 RepID=A0A836B4Z4_9CHLO|nr:hypothetical protein HYH02_007215 [Chlamydomonas schloesseri]|eukprot:KAG2447757.1 hypothetical protein HYH02_007215 [Chlamydomonas schloesseri]